MNKYMRELYFEADTRKHQQLVAQCLLAVAKDLMDRAVKHDASKFSEYEKPFYVDPVYELNHSDIKYGSTEYQKLTGIMGEGWKHHSVNNDHHIEFFVPYSVQTLNDPIRAMDLFSLVEMVCDWIAASKRKGNEPHMALEQLHKEFSIDEQLQAIIRNTLNMIERRAFKV